MTGKKKIHGAGAHQSASVASTGLRSYIPKADVVGDRPVSSPGETDVPSDRANRVVLRTSFDTTTVSVDEILERISRYLIERTRKLVQVSDEAISSLIRSRELLALMIEHHSGGISSEEFETRAREYLQKRKRYEPEVLQEKIRVLLSIVSKPLDTEVIAEIFYCELEDAERAIAELARALQSESKSGRLGPSK